MKPLDRKLLRDLSRLWPQVAAIALLGAIGVAVAVMAWAGLKAITVAEDRFYGQTRFADLFAGAERAPSSLAPRLKALDGVLAVDARPAAGGLMAVPGLRRPATVRLIGLPDDPAGALNRLVLAGGRMPGPDTRDEAVALKAFMDAAHVSLGDRLTMTVGGRQASFRIVGTVLSPEYVYAPSSDSSLPDDAHNAVLWAPRIPVEQAAGQVGAFAQVALKLSAGVDPARVTPAVDRLLAPYGGTLAVARKDQPSNAIIDGGLKRLRRLSLVMPPFFLIVAAALTNVVIGRLVETEREQIGLLKAFGYSDGEAAAPYLKLSAVIGLAGALTGGILGAVLAALLTGLWSQYFRFPVFTPQFDWSVFAATSVLAMGAAVGGSVFAVRRVARLRPAVALQAAPPTAYRRGLLDMLNLTRWLDQPTRMILRRIERFPGKAVLTVVGLVASLALLVGTQFMFGALDHVVEHAYYRTQRWNEQLGFFHPRQAESILEAARLPGVLAAEPIRVTAAWATGPLKRKRIPIIGLDPGAALARPLSHAGGVVPFQGRGVILSQALSQELGVRPGGVVALDFLEGRRPRVDLPVTAVAEDYSGGLAYMARGPLNRILGDGDLASGAELLTAADDPGPLYAALEARPQVVSAASRDETVADWRSAMAKSFSVAILFYLSFAAAIAFGVAYNMGRITLAERSRDLATLRVLGFSRIECAYILLGELALLTLAATPVGIGAGIGLAHVMAVAFRHEDLRFPVIITAHTLALSLSGYLAAVILAAAMLAPRIWRLDLVAVLKTRD